MTSLTDRSGSSAKVLIFDSGVGGLTIFEAVQKRLPECQLIFASDNEGYPYGPKSVDELVPRVNLVLSRCIAAVDPDIVVVACNTASTVALPTLRNAIATPIIGVVPAIKSAAIKTKTGTIGLLATPGTVKRDYTKGLIDEFASECKVISVGTSELVEIAERKLRGESVSRDALLQIVSPFRDAAMLYPPLDKVVLACTHFPLLADELGELLPERIELIDSGEAISRRVEQIISEIVIEPSLNDSRQSMALFVRPTEKIEQLAAALSKFGIHSHRFIGPV